MTYLSQYNCLCLSIPPTSTLEVGHSAMFHSAGLISLYWDEPHSVVEHFTALWNEPALYNPPIIALRCCCSAGSSSLLYSALHIPAAVHPSTAQTFAQAESLTPFVSTEKKNAITVGSYKTIEKCLWCPTGALLARTISETVTGYSFDSF